MVTKVEDASVTNPGFVQPKVSWLVVVVMLRKLPELVAKVNVLPAVPLIWVEVVTNVDDANVTKPGFVQLNAS